MMLYKMIDFYTSTNNPVEPLYKLSDYVIETQPHRTKKQTIDRRVQKHIFSHTKARKSILYSLPQIDIWIDPDPVYT